MNNPWLAVPLADYEAHMASAGIEQAQLLSDMLSAVLGQFSPRSVAVIGCAGGNGFDRIPAGMERVVGVDINPHFIAATAARYGGRFKNLELIVGDIQGCEVSFAPVDLVFLGLVLEYVDVEAVIARVTAMLTANGRLATVVQLPSASHGHVSASSFQAIQALGKFMHLVPPPRVRKAAEIQGYAQLTSDTVTSNGGKHFQLQVYSRSPAIPGNSAADRVGR